MQRWLSGCRNTIASSISISSSSSPPSISSLFRTTTAVRPDSDRRRNVTTYAWGNCDHGQLGLPEYKLQDESDTIGRRCSTPQEIDDLRGEPLRSVSLSSSHCGVVLERSGELLMCGYNGEGQLGSGDVQPRTRFTRIKNLPTVKSVSCGGRHTLVLCEDGLVFSFGWNKFGQLGLSEHEVIDKHNEIQHTPQLIKRLVEDGKKIVEIHTGDDFSVCLCDQGKLYSWGTSYYGALGNSSEYEQETYNNHPRLIQSIREKQFEEIIGGKRHVIAIEKDRKNIYGWGNGRHYLLGNEDEGTVYQPMKTFEAFHHTNGIKKICFGNSHAVILSNNDLVYTLGENNHGCLGLDHDSMLDNITSYSNPVYIKEASPAVDIAGGWNFSSAILKQDGQVVTWGSSHAGALGIEESNHHMKTPQTIALKKAKRIFASSSGTSVIATT